MDNNNTQNQIYIWYNPVTAAYESGRKSEFENLTKEADKAVSNSYSLILKLSGEKENVLHKLIGFLNQEEIRICAEEIQ